MAELLVQLRSMGEDVFSRYVTESHNDFAVWIKSVFSDGELADIVRETRTRDETRIAIHRYITSGE